jgi:UDP-N-acetylglucosamine--N-acetylmuramyl-(pentapeptide) pyrophosphoryl-undecaprenol N-acetylglucosamine transferase
LKHCHVLHVSGGLTYEATRHAADAQLAALSDSPESHGRYRLYPYLNEEMPAALAACDIALCRSGASTLTELAVMGRPSVLVPLPPGFTGSPQAVNAEMFRRAGAAEVALDRNLTPATLGAALYPLLDNPPRLALMSSAARALGHPDAAPTLAEMVASLAQGG